MESENFEVVMAGSPPPIQERASVEASTSALGERRLVPAMLERATATRVDRRSPPPAAG